MREIPEQWVTIKKLILKQVSTVHKHKKLDLRESEKNIAKNRNKVHRGIHCSTENYHGEIEISNKEVQKNVPAVLISPHLTFRQLAINQYTKR